MAENIAKKMLAEADRETNRLRQINQELVFENSKLKAQLKPTDQLRDELKRAKRNNSFINESFSFGFAQRYNSYVHISQRA